MALVAGKEAIRSWVKGAFFGPFHLELAYTNDEVEIGNDWAWGRGPWSLKLTPQDGGETIDMAGKHIVIFQRGPDGAWKFARSIYNSDQPIEAPT